MTGPSLFEVWVMAFFVLALYSFLYKDNPIYKIAEHIFAGLSAGYYAGSVVWKSVILQQLWIPMTQLDRWWLIAPALLGCLMFTRFFTNLSWLSRIPLAFVMGNTAGIFLVSELHGRVLPQVQSTMKLQPDGGPTDVILTGIIVVTTVATMLYFYFSHEHRGPLGVAAKVGIWSIMVSFGALFGSTVMGRVTLLIGQVRFLIEDWIVGTFT